MFDLYYLAGKALLVHEGKCLIIQATKGYWDFPGGRLDYGEDLETALGREISEETGLRELPPSEFLGYFISPFRFSEEEGERGLVLGVYRFDLATLPTIRLSDEHLEYRWAPFKEASELLDIKFPPDFREQLAAL